MDSTSPEQLVGTEYKCVCVCDPLIRETERQGPRIHCSHMRNLSKGEGYEYTLMYDSSRPNMEGFGHSIRIYSLCIYIVGV